MYPAGVDTGSRKLSELLYGDPRPHTRQGSTSVLHVWGEQSCPFKPLVLHGPGWFDKEALRASRL